MRKRVSQSSGDQWLQLPQDEREQIKAKLPELVVSEQRCASPFSKLQTHHIHVEFSNLVRHSTARVIAAIAYIELPMNSWNQLLPFLEQTCQSPTAIHREVGVYILYTVLETIVEGFENHLPSFFKLFAVLLNDPESAEVRITTVRYVRCTLASCALLMYSVQSARCDCAVH